MKKDITAVLTVVLFFVFGCGKKIATIEVQPERRLLTSKSETLQLRVTPKDKEGTVLRDVPVMFKSLNPTLATVDPLGNVRAIQSGIAAILITSGEFKKEIEVLIQIPHKIVIEPATPLMMVGVTKQFIANIFTDRDKQMIAGQVRWSSTDPTIFTVDQDGNVKTLKEGSATLSAHAAGIQGKTEITVKHEALQEDGTVSQ